MTENFPHVSDAPAYLYEGSGGGGGCFMAGTEITTPEGTKRIEAVQVGDEVIGFDEAGKIVRCRVVETHKHPKDVVLAVEFWRGRLLITGNHWVLNQYNAFAAIGTMDHHDALIDGNGHLRPIHRVTTHCEAEVYNLTVEPTHTFIANGIRVHNGGVGQERVRNFLEGSGGGGGGKGGGGAARAAVEAPNTLRSKTTARVVDVLGEGPIKGLVAGAKSIYLDDTALMGEDGAYNFEGVKWEFRSGTPEQDPLSGIPYAEKPMPLDITVNYGTPLVRTFTDEDVDAVRIIMGVPQLTNQDPNTGDMSGSFVDFQIELRSDGGPWTMPVLRRVWAEFSGQTPNYTAGLSVTVTAPSVGGGSSGAYEILVEYREVGASDWLPLGSETGTVGNPAYQDVVTDWETGQQYPTGPISYGSTTVTKTFTLNELDGAIYEVRAVKGTITSRQGYSPAPLRIEGKCTAPYQRAYRVDLPKGGAPWDIRITRLSEEASTVNISNSLSWAGYVEIVDDNLMYPDCALIGMSVDAEYFGNNIPQRSYEIYGLIVEVPSNYDPYTRTYTGLWDGTFKQEWTNNPAWCVRDMILNDRYGLGDVIKDYQVDKWALYQIAQYCDELVPDGVGGTEPRMSLNCLINTREQAHQLINTMVSAFRGMAYWGTGAIWFVQDCPKDVVAIVGPANVIEGEFNYQGTADRARHNVAVVTWNNPLDSYRADLEVVEDNDDIVARGWRPVEVFAFGCTSRAQAQRLGRWLLYTEQFEDGIVTYRAGLDHAEINPGDIVEVRDPSLEGARYQGRIAEVSTDLQSVTLDDEIVIDTEDTFTLSVVMPDLSVVQATVANAPGTHSVLQLVAPLSRRPVAGAIWSISGGYVQGALYRIMAKSEPERHQYEITASRYYPGKFDLVEQGIAFDAETVDPLSSGAIKPATGLVMSEHLYKTNNQLKTRVTLSWVKSADKRVTQYSIDFRAPSGNWMNLTTTSELSVDLADAEVGTYEFKIYAVSIIGRSPALSGTLAVLGRLAPPADVTGLRATRTVSGIQLSWDKVTDLDLVGYEVRDGSDWDASAASARDAFATTIFIAVEDAADHRFMVRAKDTSGIYSAGIATIVASVVAPDDVAIFNVVPQGDFVNLQWQQVAGLNLEYEVRAGESWSAGVLVKRSAATEATVLFPGSGEATFWIKAVSAAGLYSATARFAKADLVLAADRNVVLAYDNRDAGYPGVTHRMAVGPSGGLELADNTPNVTYRYGEHYFKVDLGAEYRARNWQDVRFAVISSNPMTWADATFAWNSAPAEAPWLPTGDIDGATFERKVAAYLGGGLEGEVLAVTFDQTCAGNDGTLPAEDNDVEYLPARVAKGAYVAETTSISYSVSIPSTFTVALRLKLDATLDANATFVYAVVYHPAGRKLTLAYERLTGKLYVEDHLHNRLEVAMTLDPTEEFLFVALAQNSTDWSLYYKAERAYSDGYVSGAHAPLGTFNHLYLYDAQPAV